jgi:hypothetical protein
MQFPYAWPKVGKDSTRRWQKSTDLVALFILPRNYQCDQIMTANAAKFHNFFFISCSPKGSFFPCDSKKSSKLKLSLKGITLLHEFNTIQHTASTCRVSNKNVFNDHFNNWAWMLGVKCIPPWRWCTSAPKHVVIYLKWLHMIFQHWC